MGSVNWSASVNQQFCVDDLPATNIQPATTDCSSYTAVAATLSVPYCGHGGGGKDAWGGENVNITYPNNIGNAGVGQRISMDKTLHIHVWCWSLGVWCAPG
jgi:hypothetical protein